MRDSNRQSFKLRRYRRAGRGLSDYDGVRRAQPSYAGYMLRYETDEGLEPQDRSSRYSPDSTAFLKRAALVENSTAHVPAAAAAPTSWATMKPGT